MSYQTWGRNVTIPLDQVACLVIVESYVNPKGEEVIIQDKLHVYQ